MMKSWLRALSAGLLLGLVGPVAGSATEPVMRDNPPEVYYVEQGDTLWDIASRFLKNPWAWPELWHHAEDVDDPHLIFPGDVIRLTFVDDEPQLEVEREPEEIAIIPEDPEVEDPTDLPMVRMTPEVREMSLDEAIPAIPLRKIRSYLRDALVVTGREIREAPHVVGGQDGRVAFGQGDEIYARDREGQWEDLLRNYGIYRVGEQYVDPETDEVLGYEALEIGRGSVLDHQGELITLRLQRSSEEIREQDRLFSTRREERMQAVFHPSSPEEEVNGRIIRFFDRMNSVARDDVVVINKGARDGLEEGNVLQVMQTGQRVRDRVHDDLVTLPDTRAGTMMLFAVHETVSFGLIMESTRPIFMHDRVVNPR